MPAEGITLKKHDDILSNEEIIDVVTHGAKLGISKVRFTGGEPLVRKGIISLISRIKQIQGINELAMTTNGLLLPKYAKDLKRAGLDRVNISLDTLDPKQYQKITRIGDIKDVKKGVFAALAADLSPVKINVVKLKNEENQNIDLIRNFCNKYRLQIRIIDEMNLETGEFSIVDGGEGGNCSICNRLRLTSNGDIKPCLFSNSSINIRKYGICQAFKMALQDKPEYGEMSTNHTFYTIGG
tara:strand:+ start:1443 stop:2162 length:720 start_codon:yes stop_codon:yes gene_type:complete